MIAASNAKLATTFAALIALSPNYRWKTGFFLAEEQNDPPTPGRQGLLVRGEGDPSMVTADLRQIAIQLNALGLREIPGALYYDSSRFGAETIPNAFGGANNTQAWSAPISPFILDSNALQFFISTNNPEGTVEVLPEKPGKFLEVVSKIQRASVTGPQVHVSQAWEADSAKYTFMGRAPEKAGSFPFGVAVEQPVDYFFYRLRDALKEQGISGEMPLEESAGKKLNKKLLYTHISSPLRELIVQINKESDNLAAAAVVRTSAKVAKTRPLTQKAGLSVLNGVLQNHFPGFEDQFLLRDGAGLSRETKMSASFFVHLLNRVRNHPEFRAEYMSSLSLGGWDGTLRYRNFPAAMQGRVRAKSGTLQGVQNLSGYLQLENDVVVFSFLINAPGKKFQTLQRSQDAVLTGVYQEFVDQEARKLARILAEKEAKEAAEEKKMALKLKLNPPEPSYKKKPKAPLKLEPPEPSYKPTRRK